MGFKDTEANTANKLPRGTFTAAFFFQVMDAIGAPRREKATKIRTGPRVKDT